MATNGKKAMKWCILVFLTRSIYILPTAARVLSSSTHAVQVICILLGKEQYQRPKWDSPPRSNYKVVLMCHRTLFQNQIDGRVVKNTTRILYKGCIFLRFEVKQHVSALCDPHQVMSIEVSLYKLLEKGCHVEISHQIIILVCLYIGG